MQEVQMGGVVQLTELVEAVAVLIILHLDQRLQK
tara:strand:- start:72 stop:173 length:102 start_codon:yes stop_codon:yes gene_type:complete